jgi:hypothetical protein
MPRCNDNKKEKQEERWNLSRGKKIDSTPKESMTDPPPVGTYCATAGAVFTSKEALTAHYKSDFHR